MAEHTLVTDEAVRLALASDDNWAADTRPSNFQALSEGRVRNLLEAAAPLIVDAKLEHAKAALVGDNEGIRLWMLDCSELAAKHRKRTDVAEAKLAAIADRCEHPDALVGLMVAVDRDAILAIISDEKEQS